MNVYSKEEFRDEKEFLFEHIMKGALFIYPTDTIYGLGCNAEDYKAVKRIREAKARYERPFSVIAPSKDWILKNCHVSREAEKWIARLPGPYTLILRLRDKHCIAPNVNADMDTIGIRIPDHWITKEFADLKVPIVTTSANIIGENFMTSMDDLNPSVKSKVDFIIYEGEKKGKPSKIIDLSDKVMIIER